MIPTELEELWNRILQRLEDEVPSSQHVYLKNACLQQGEDQELDLLLPDRFARDAIEKHRLDQRVATALRAEGNERPLRLVIKKGAGARKKRDLDPEQGTLGFSRATGGIPARAGRAASFPPPNLNPKYTQDAFVVGDGNKLAYAICEAVGKSPGTTYNPVFLYGGVGLGKTHLMQAVGHALLAARPKARVRYVPSEVFSNDYIRAVMDKRTAQFREQHRGLDLLLIDDVQFFGGKEGLQEEFFHTFNELYQAGKQIILTSDRSPKQLSDLQERLVSRFESGVVCDVKPPNVETRLAILYRLAERAGLQSAPGALEVLAERIRSNIRLLEGAFVKVQALCSLHGCQIEPAIIEEVVGEYGGGESEQARRVDVPLVQELVGEYFSVTVEEIKGKRRTKQVVLPRQLAMFLAHELTDLTLEAIARGFEKKDHTTVMHACEKVRGLIGKDAELDQALRILRSRIRAAVEG